MDKSKLKVIGAKLDVYDDDIDKMRKRYLLAKIIGPIMGALISVLFTLRGYYNGMDGLVKTVYATSGEVHSYPFACTALAGMAGLHITTAKDFKRKRYYFLGIILILTIVLSAIGYNIGYDYSNPIKYDYQVGGIMYGVYSRKGKR
jgi:hypothetical protein